MRERPKHLEKAVADPRNEEPASPLRSETALKDQAERVAALRRALLAPWHACPGLPLPRGVHGPYQKRPCRKKWSGKALRSLILATLLFGINALLKPSHAGSATGVHWSAAAFSRPLSRCFPLLYRPPVLRLWCADETSSAQWCICVPSLHLLILRREEARKGRWAGGDQVHPPALSAFRTSSRLGRRNRTCPVTLLAVHAASGHEAGCGGSFHERHHRRLPLDAAVPSAPPHAAPRSAILKREDRLTAALALAAAT